MSISPKKDHTLCDLTGYATHHIETATYDENLVVIFHTKQDIPTFAVLSNEDLDELIEELKKPSRMDQPKNPEPVQTILAT